MNNSGRIIIIGLDGVPYELLENLSNSGIMPNTKKLIQSGIFKKMFSSMPEISSVAWPSIITGKNPGEHGMFGFTDFVPDSYRICFPNFNNLKTPPFWARFKGKSVIINVPSTFPAKPMNGAHISGFVSIDLERSVYPLALLPKLKEFDYRVDVESEKAHKSMDMFLTDLDKTLTARVKTYQYLWDEEEWQI